MTPRSGSGFSDGEGRDSKIWSPLGLVSSSILASSFGAADTLVGRLFEVVGMLGLASIEFELSLTIGGNQGGEFNFGAGLSLDCEAPLLWSSGRAAVLQSSSGNGLSGTAPTSEDCPRLGLGRASTSKDSSRTI